MALSYINYVNTGGGRDILPEDPNNVRLDCFYRLDTGAASMTLVNPEVKA